ncbi:transglycosylase SLT domain-containing protein [Fodinibius sp.]|uniref:transglycosylase SLT domain-containing protein n=1 Tax=Fodinibius sp. TaxID=1872440 RepID=UPI002ACDFA53|nr:transglycosylase SLT domain-containing protein [Fodinibius sp.]MDZ7658838.1 transglycosylase SLT domain-containing protein [Fodinibius sp.]
MQIDDRYHSFATIAAPSNNKANINYGAKYLSELRDQFGNIKDALVAYNAGPNAVNNARSLGMNPDHLTTGGDYSFDVLQRANLIRSELGLGFANVATVLPAAALLLAGSTYLYYQLTDKKMPTFLTDKI